MDQFNRSKGGIIIKWTIENMCFHSTVSGVVVESPHFRIADSPRIKWNLLFEHNDEGEIDLVLRRSTEVVDIFKIFYNAYFHEADEDDFIMRGERNFKKNQASRPLNSFKAVESRDLLAKRKVILLIHMWTLQSSRSDKMVICKARSCFEANNLKLQWKLYKWSYMHNEPRQRFIIPDNWENSLPLKLVLHVPPEDCLITDLCFDIVSYTELRSDTEVVLKITMSNTAGQEIASGESKFSFHDAATIWHFPKFEVQEAQPLLIRELLLNDILVADFEFWISIGGKATFIEETQIVEVIRLVN